MKHQPIFLSLLLATALVNTAAAEDQLTRKYFVAVRSQLDVRAQAALERVHGLGRQLLATRDYLRAGIGLDGRWSWTQQQIDAYAESGNRRTKQLHHLAARDAHVDDRCFLHRRLNDLRRGKEPA